MRFSRKLYGVMLALLLFAGSPAAAVADLYWESVQVNRGIPGLIDGQHVLKTYLTAKACRVETGREVLIFDFTLRLVYQLEPGPQTYTKLTLAALGAVPALPGVESETVQDLMNRFLGGVQVIPTREEKTVSGHRCRKFLFSFMLIRGEVWASKQVKAFPEFIRNGQIMAQVLRDSPLLQSMDFAGMLGQLDGFPVEVIFFMAGGHSTTTLKKIEQRPLEPDLFQVPRGYSLRH